MNPPSKKVFPSNFESFVAWLGQQSAEDQSYLIKLAFEDQQLRHLERTFASLRLDQRQDIFQRLGLADHLVKQIPSSGSGSGSLPMGAVDPKVESQGAADAPTVGSRLPVSARAGQSSRAAKNIGPVVAFLALIGVVGGLTLYAGPNIFSGLKLTRNNPSVPDEVPPANQPSEQLAEVEAPVDEVKDQVTEQVTLRSNGPSWVTLRRNGQVEFEGNLEGEKVVDRPVEIEIYAGRPDLVEVIAEGQPPRTLGAIDDIKWLPLMR